MGYYIDYYGTLEIRPDKLAAADAAVAASSYSEETAEALLHRAFCDLPTVLVLDGHLVADISSHQKSFDEEDVLKLLAPFMSDQSYLQWRGEDCDTPAKYEFKNGELVQSFVPEGLYIDGVEWTTERVEAAMKVVKEIAAIVDMPLVPDCFTKTITPTVVDIAARNRMEMIGRVLREAGFRGASSEGS